MSVPSQLDPSDLGEDAQQGDANSIIYNEEYFVSTNSNTLTDVPKNIYSDTVSMTGESHDGFETAKLEKTRTDKTELPVTVDEDAIMMFNQPSPDVNSPRDIVSPSGELSSPFSAMESDGEGMETGFEDASLSAPGDAVGRPTGFFGASSQLDYTTTPGASSSAADDHYESSGSRKKRRKTRRDMHPSCNLVRPNGPSLLRFPKPTAQITPGEGWYHDPDTSPFSPPTCPKGMNFNFAESSSRRSSSGAPTLQPQKNDYVVENAKRTKTCDDANTSINVDIQTSVKTEISSTLDTPVTATTSGVRRRHTHHRTSTSATVEEELNLHKQFPRKAESCELKILSQPEAQHRARYLTEGSRGPVKDATQQGFPKVQLLGHKGPALLQVFVATDSGKIKPHGFYQACRVTGRNTSTCEESEIEGTTVIEIPFKQDDMVISVDCVGILKLRNTDVEVRTGIRNQKRNQSVRLVFRVCFQSAHRQDETTLQVASSRVSCTQPLGQPEISKKSIDRCSVAGGIEMFIIGKNFHRGTRVIYQDPEEPNDTQWSAEGEVDKDTFHQSHMVVRVPPYHDLNIVKPVNVQLLVEFQDKRCEPHSFTYFPRQKEPEPPKEDSKKVTQVQENSNTPNIQTALSLLDGPIDKKFLVALFSKLLAGGITAQNDAPNANDTADVQKLETQSQQSLLATAATTQQSFINAELQRHAREMIVPDEQKPALFAPASSIAVTNPFANIQFVQPPNNIAVSQATNTIQPGQFANFPNFAFPTNTSVNYPGANIKVESEIEGQELVPTAVVTTTVQCTPIMATAVNQNPPLNFAPPQIQNVSSPQMVVSPIMHQSTPYLPQTGGILQNTLSPPNMTTVTQSFVPNNFTPTVVTMGEDAVSKTNTVQQNTIPNQQTQVVFGVPHLQQGTPFASVTGVTPISTTDLLPKQPVPSFQVTPGQQNIQNLFANAIVNQPQVSLAPITNQVQVTLTDTIPLKEDMNVTNSQQNTMHAMTFATNASELQGTTRNFQQGSVTFPNSFGTKPQFLENPVVQSSSNEHGTHTMLNINPPSFIETSHQQFTIGNQETTIPQPGSHNQSSFGNTGQQQLPIGNQVTTVSQNQPGTNNKSSFTNTSHQQFTIGSQKPNIPQQFTIGNQEPVVQHQQVGIHNQSSFSDTTHQQFTIGSQEPAVAQKFTIGNQEPGVQHQPPIGHTQSNFSNTTHQQFTIETQEPAVAQQFTIGNQEPGVQHQPPIGHIQSNFSTTTHQQFTIEGQKPTILQQFTIGNQEPTIQHQTSISHNPSNFSDATHQQFTIGNQEPGVQHQPASTDNQSSFIDTRPQQFTIGSQAPSRQYQQTSSHNQSNISDTSHQQFAIGSQEPSIQQQQPSNQLMQMQQEQGKESVLQRPQDAQMHVDPFVEAPNPVKMQTDAANIPQNNNYTPQQVTQMTTINKIQPMEEMVLTQAGAQVRQMKEVVSPQQVFQHQAIRLVPDTTPVSATITIQGFQTPQSSNSPPVSVNTQQVTQTQNYQSPPQIHNTNNINMITTSLGGQTFPAPQPVQPSIVTPSVPTQIFQTQPPTEHMATPQSSPLPMQTQPYLSVAKPTQELLTTPTGVQQSFQTLPTQNQQPTTSTPMQITNDYVYPANSSGQITTPNVMANTVVPQPNPGSSMNPNHQLEQVTPDLFAMDQLLQSIDGSQHLAAMTGEDVQRQFL